MKTSSVNLLSSSSSGSDVFGTPQKAVGYYSCSSNLQTISWYLTGFIGKITIEATLDSDSASINYASIHVIDTATAITENDFINLSGKYTWIKATVTSYSAGAIGKVTMGF